MLIALTEGKGSSYMDSRCELLASLCDGCSSLIFALLRCKMIMMVVVKTTALVISATTRITTLVISATTGELMVARYAVLVHISMLLLPCGVVVCPYTLNVSLTLPIILSQSTVCTAKLHIVSSLGTSVQVTLVWLVVVGQLPQFDARML